MNTPTVAKDPSSVAPEQDSGRSVEHRDHTPRSIFVAIDFSAASFAALDRAVVIARAVGATVTLLHVIEDGATAGSIGYSPDTVVVGDAIDPQAMAERLHGLAQSKIPSECLGQSLVSTGAAGPTIVAIAQQRAADLIVVATRGHSSLARALLGSTADYLVREGLIPVLTVPARPDAADAGEENFTGQIKQILIPMDLSEPSLKSFVYGVSLARRLNATVMLAHVVPYLTIPRGEPMQESRLNLHAADAAETKLREISRGAIAHDVAISTTIATGEAVEEINRLAVELSSDLLVIATHGTGGVERALLGSTAQKILHHATCPVLVVRRPEPHDTSRLSLPLFFPVAPFTP